VNDDEDVYVSTGYMDPSSFISQLKVRVGNVTLGQKATAYHHRFCCFLCQMLWHLLFFL
jgi:hypothetical protein